MYTALQGTTHSPNVHGRFCDTSSTWTPLQGAKLVRDHACGASTSFRHGSCYVLWKCCLRPPRNGLHLDPQGNSNWPRMHSCIRPDLGRYTFGLSWQRPCQGGQFVGKITQRFAAGCPCGCKKLHLIFTKVLAAR